MIGLVVMLSIMVLSVVTFTVIDGITYGRNNGKGRQKR